MLTEIRVVQKQDSAMLKKLDYTVHGNGTPGLKTLVDRHEQSLKVYRRALWAIGTPALVAIGSGLVYLLAHVK